MWSWSEKELERGTFKCCDTFAWNSNEIDKSNFAPKGKVIGSPHNTCGADKK